MRESDPSSNIFRRSRSGDSSRWPCVADGKELQTVDARTVDARSTVGARRGGEWGARMRPPNERIRISTHLCVALLFRRAEVESLA